MKVIQNTLKLDEKFSDVPIFFRVGPKKVGSVGFPETREFFFCLMRKPVYAMCEQHLRSLISVFVIRFLDSVISIDAIS